MKAGSIVVPISGLPTQWIVHEVKGNTLLIQSTLDKRDYREVKADNFRALPVPTLVPDFKFEVGEGFLSPHMVGDGHYHVVNGYLTAWNQWHYDTTLYTKDNVAIFYGWKVLTDLDLVRLDMTYGPHLKCHYGHELINVGFHFDKNVCRVCGKEIK